MRKLLLLLLLIFSSVCFSAKENIIFFQYANKGTLSKLHDNSYILTLINVPDYLCYFIKDNTKKSGMISLKQFAGLWKDTKLKNNIIDNPPRAAFSLVSQNGIFINAVVAVSNPSYIKRTLSYQITVMNDKLLEIGDLKNLVLVFDDISWNPAE